MHTTPLPTAGTDLPRRAAVRWRRVGLAGILALACGAGSLGYWRLSNPPAPAAPVTLEPVRWGNLSVSVTSSGNVVPVRSSDLSFRLAGRIADLTVVPGQHVTAGDPLARLDDTALRRAVAQSEVDLVQAEASLAAARDGEARPADLAEAEAGLAAAQAQLQQTRVGTARPADLTGAEANLAAAQSRLDALLSPAVANLSTAEANLTRAREQRDATSAARSSAKTSAEAEVQQAANRVRATQQHVSDSYWQLQGVSEHTPRYADLKRAYDQAVRDEQDAQSQLQQAQVAYDNAVTQETADVRAADAALTAAEAELAALQTPDGRAVAEARAAVDGARAARDRLRQGGTPAEIAAAQAEVSRAAARRDALAAPAAPSAIASAEAAVVQARLNLETARADLAEAILRAPFSGVIADTPVAVGAQVGAGAPVLTLIDISALELTLDLSEYDVQQVSAGQPAEISFETLPEQRFDGTVTTVAPVGKENGNLTTYAVTVRFDPQEATLKIGMTGDVAIRVATSENAVQVPNRALQGAGSIRQLRVRRADAPAAEQIAVRTGLSDGAMTEVIACVPDGTQCLGEGDQVEIAAAPTGAAGAGESVLIAAPPGATGPRDVPVSRPLGTP